MNEDQVIDAALAILETRLQKTDAVIKSPVDAQRYLVLKLADRKAEVFAILFLNNSNAVIEYRELFQGTIDGTVVYPREVVRAVIETNAARVILVHNHPSTNPAPSSADEKITRRLIAALALIDVDVLDHLIVAGTRVTSLATEGFM